MVKKISRMSIEDIKRKVVPILKRNKVIRAGIFGSYARGEETKDSDVDILVELGSEVGFGFVGIQFEIEEKLKKKVDLLTYKSVNPYLKKRIFEEEVRLI